MLNRPPWKCPRCGRRFANRNQVHSCGRYSVRDHLRGKSRTLATLYKQIEALVKQCGSVSVAATKSRITFQARTVFAAVTFKSDHLIIQLTLARHAIDDSFFRVDSPSQRLHIHHARIYSLESVDSRFRRFLREAYIMGSNAHLRRVI